MRWWCIYARKTVLGSWHFAYVLPITVPERDVDASIKVYDLVQNTGYRNYYLVQEYEDDQIPLDIEEQQEPYRG